MFLSGSSGTGKTRLLQVIASGIRLLYDGPEDLRPYGPVVLTSTTGGGAFNIRGHVWGRVFAKSAHRTPILTACVARFLQATLGGVKLLIIDDINFLSLEDLWDIDLRLCTAKRDFTKPFGGVSIIFSGDLYNMKAPFGTSIAERCVPCTKVMATRGRFLFDQLTHFADLKLNVRSGAGLLSPLADFVREARSGAVSHKTLCAMNERVVNGIHNALQLAHPKAMWIVSNHKRAVEINELFMDDLVLKGRRVTRLVAVHKSSRRCDSPPSLIDQQVLFSVCSTLRHDINGALNGGPTAPSFIDICVGTRVRFTVNIAPSIGLYVGAMGTIRGLVYSGDGPATEKDRIPTHFAGFEGERPIVLVRLDGSDDDEMHLSCCDSVTRLVPVVQVAGLSRLTAEGRRFNRYQYPFLPAHGRTGHSISGVTAEQGVVDDTDGGRFFAGQYVALSRARTIDDIHLLAPLQSSHFEGFPDFRQSVNTEYERLNSSYSADNFRRNLV